MLPEVSISPIHPEEPPSPYGLLEHIRLTSRRNLQFALSRTRKVFRRFQIRHHALMVSVSTGLVAVAAYGTVVLLHPPRVQALGTDDRERVEVAVSSYFDPFTIAPQPADQT